VYGFEFRVQGLGRYMMHLFRVLGLLFRVLGLLFRVWGLEFRVKFRCGLDRY